MRKPLISVIIPVYNVEKYIAKCIESVINQTYRNLEIIIVNDGSTDKSGTICDIYRNQDSRIKVIHKMNGGLSAARNAGIEIMSGEYVTFIDSDDYVNRRFIQILYESLVKEDADISICNYRHVYESCEHSQEIGSSFNEIVFNHDQSLDCLYSKIYKYQFTTAWGKLYNSNLFNEVRYPVGRNYEDMATTHKVLDLSSKVVYIDVELYYYLVRNTSITKSEKHIKNDAFLATKDRIEYFEKSGYHSLQKRAIIQHINTIMGIIIRVDNDNKERIDELNTYLIHELAMYKNYLLKSPLFSIRLCLFFLSKKIYRLIILGKNHVKA